MGSTVMLIAARGDRAKTCFLTSHASENSCRETSSRKRTAVRETERMHYGPDRYAWHCHKARTLDVRIVILTSCG